MDVYEPQFHYRPTCKICTDIINFFFQKAFLQIGDLFVLLMQCVVKIAKKWQNILIVR